MAEKKSGLQAYLDFVATGDKLREAAKGDFATAINELRQQLDTLNDTGKQLGLTKYIITTEAPLVAKTGRTRTKVIRNAEEIKAIIEANGKVALSSLPDECNGDDDAAMAWLGKGYKVTHTGKRGLAAHIVEKK